nr:amidohydrolase [Bacteroidota bacterium]
MKCLIARFNAWFLVVPLIVVLLGWNITQNKADAVYYNGTVYTVDSTFSTCEAFAVKNGKVVWTGNSRDAINFVCPVKVDLRGQFVYPGFIDAHCHFYGYGVDQKKIDLTGTSSFRAVLDTLTLHKTKLFSGWLFGRGWDQNDWANKTYPNKSELDKLFPNVPVFLLRVDGHAALCNSLALQQCNVNVETKIEGGEIEKIGGELTGILIDNAVDLVKSKIPLPDKKAETQALLTAQKNCNEVGLTTVCDAGLSKEVILLIDSLQQSNILKMRYYAMIEYDAKNAKYFFDNGKIKTERLNACSFKMYADGALGSRGACMRDAYHDRQAHHGFLLHTVAELQQAANDIAQHNFQMNTHCIGDSANHLMLQIYANALKGKKDARWRIEHAQVLASEDIGWFAKYGIIPSVQPTHATSDMYWAQDRVGAERMKAAYAYKQLLDVCGMIAAGSDFPVESINPMFGFYAAVARKDQKGYPKNGFQKQDAISRQDALRAMTIWAAYAAFEEKEKGSIEAGKFADFVITSQDIMKHPENDLFNIKVKQTFINGERVF